MSRSPSHDAASTGQPWRQCDLQIAPRGDASEGNENLFVRFDSFQAGPIEPGNPIRNSASRPFDPVLGLIAEHYDLASDEYRYWSPEGYLHAGLWRWGLNPFYRRGLLESANQFVFDELELKDLASGLVVDLGCGYGSVANFGAKLYPRLQWLGVSLSSHQIEIGRLSSMPNVELQQMDYHHLGLPDESVSAAYFLESFCYCQDPRAVFAQMLRLLRPGGRLTIVDGMLRRPWSKVRGISRWLANQAARGWAIAEFPEVSNILRMANDVGLELVQHREVGMRTWPSMFSVPWLVGRRMLPSKLSRQRNQSSEVQSRNREILRRHLAACLCGAAMSLFRRQFGYYILTWRKG